MNVEISIRMTSPKLYTKLNFVIAENFTLFITNNELVSIQERRNILSRIQPGNKSKGLR